MRTQFKTVRTLTSAGCLALGFSAIMSPVWAHPGNDLHTHNLPIDRSKALEDSVATLAAEDSKPLPSQDPDFWPITDNQPEDLSRKSSALTSADRNDLDVTISNEILTKRSDAPVKPQAVVIEAPDIAVEVKKRSPITKIERPKYTLDLQTSTKLSTQVAETRRKLVEAIAEGRPDESALADYAKSLMSAGMFAEAQGVIAELASRRENPRAMAMQRALHLLSDNDGDIGSTNFVWKEATVWAFLEQVREGNIPSEESIKHAAADLSRQSIEVAEAVSHKLFDAAMSAENPQLAREVLGQILNSTNLSGSPRLILMQARLAQFEGREQAAYDMYMAASKDESAVGVEALLGLAEMALSRNDPRLLPRTKEFLVEAREKWQGDKLGLRTLLRLAQVAEELPDLMVALETIAEIAADFPGTKEATLAEVRLPILLERFRLSISENEYPLERAITEVRRLDPNLNAFEGWLEVRQALASRLVGKGLHAAAVLELEAIDRARRNAAPLAVKAIDDLVMGLAESYLAMGMKEEAAAILNGHVVRRASQNRRFIVNSLKARAPLEENFLRMIEDDFAGDLVVQRHAAAALMDAEKFAYAADAYERLFALGGEIENHEAHHYARAISQDGREDSGIIALQDKALRIDTLKRGISDPEPSRVRLTKETAAEIVDKAGDTLDASREIVEQ